MKRIGQILGLFTASLIAVNCFSQQVIATAGSSGTGSGIELSWTIGEPVTATAHGADFYLTQGFHQSQPITAMVNQELSFSAGWNIVSARVIPGNKNMMDIFQLLISANILKKVMDESGNVVEDWGYFGGWQNTIGSLRSTEGYKVNVNTQTTLSVGGTTFLFPFYIPLSAGWNIISWPSANEQDGMEVFQALKNEGKLKKVMDESGAVIEDWGYFGGWQNTIGNLKPGEGYKVNVTGDCILVIYDTGTKSEVILPEVIASSHFIPAFKGNGTDHMNINLVNLAESGIKYGDEIGIFDGNVCVGSAQILNNNSSIINNQFFIGIPVSAVDGITGKNGYTEGNSITMKLFRNGNEYPLTIQPLNQSKTVFVKGSSLFAQVDLTTGLDGMPGSNTTEINCYPNPFSDEVTIELNLLKNTEVFVEVLNQLGQQVKTLSAGDLLNRGTHRLTWDGTNAGNSRAISGVYIIRIKIDNAVYYRKVIYSK